MSFAVSLVSEAIKRDLKHPVMWDNADYWTYNNENLYVIYDGIHQLPHFLKS